MLAPPAAQPLERCLRVAVELLVRGAGRTARGAAARRPPRPPPRCSLLPSSTARPSAVSASTGRSPLLRRTQPSSTRVASSSRTASALQRAQGAEEGRLPHPGALLGPGVVGAAQQRGQSRRAEVAVEARHAGERGGDVGGGDRRTRARGGCRQLSHDSQRSRRTLLAEVVGDARVAAAAAARVVHHLVEPRVGVLAQHRLRVEVGGRGAQPRHPATVEQRAGAAQEVERCADHVALAAGQALLPVVEVPAALAQHLAVHVAHRVALRVGLLDEERLEVAIGRAVQQRAVGALAVAARRGPPPGSTARCCRGSRGGRRCGCRAGRCPCRTRRWRRPPRCRRRRSPRARGRARRRRGRRGTRRRGSRCRAGARRSPRWRGPGRSTRWRGPAARAERCSSAARFCCCPRQRTTPRRSSGRTKPVTRTSGSSMPSDSTMSPRTRGVAVAVKAPIGWAAAERGGLAQPAVVGTEVVAPAGDAVRLVDGQPGDPQARQRRGERGDPEALRGDVEEAQRARARRGPAPPPGCRGPPASAAPRRRRRASAAAPPGRSSARSAGRPPG